MGYIRSNEDYFQSIGMSPAKARREAKIYESGALDRIDYGFCNPRKAKQAAEEEAEIRNRFFGREREG